MMSIAISHLKKSLNKIASSCVNHSELKQDCPQTVDVQVCYCFISASEPLVADFGCSMAPLTCFTTASLSKGSIVPHIFITKTKSLSNHVLPIVLGGSFK